MSPLRIFGLTSLAMLAFAGNSLLCRLALKHTSIDAASFTAIRLVSGAMTLFLIVKLRRTARTALTGQGNWLSAFALFAYAAGFSFAYVSLTAATGALTSGIGYAIWYTALPALKATQAATVQLSVPVIAALGGIVFLGETLTLRLILASIAILVGIALVILERRQV